MERYINDFFTRTLDAPWFIELFCVSLATIICLGHRKNLRYLSWQRLVEWIAVAAAFFVLSFLFNLLPAFLPFMLGIGSSLRILALAIIYAATRSRYSWPNRIVMVGVVYYFATVFTYIGTIIGNIISAAIPGFDIAITKIAADILIVGVSLITIRFPVYRFKDNVREAYLNSIVNFISAALLVAFDAYRIHSADFRELNQTVMSFVTLTMLGILAINITTYFITYKLCNEKKRALDFQRMEQRSNTLNELLLLSEQNVNQLKSIRHDIKNQYIYMQSMLENEKYDDLKAYYEELVGTFAKPLFTQSNCGNKLIDSIFDLETKKATAAGVKCEIKAVLPSELPFARADLLALLTNIIDNAIEAVEREKIPEASIAIESGIQGGYFALSVANPTTKPARTDIKSLKTEKEQKAIHGHGIKIVQNIVARYNGIYKAAIQEGRFEVEVVLDLNANAEDNQ